MNDPSRQTRTLCASLRDQVREELPQGAFLGYARGDGLFAVKRAEDSELYSALERIRASGMLQRDSGGVISLSPGENIVRAFEEAFPDPPDAFCASFLRFRCKRASAQALEVFALGLKWTMLPIPEARYIYDKKTRRLAAEQMRLGICGGLYGCALLRSTICGLHE